MRKLAAVTLLYSRDYLPGCYTLGHRLREWRESGFEFEVVVLTTDALLEELEEVDRHLLTAVFDEVLVAGVNSNDVRKRGLPAVQQGNAENLLLLGRPELNSTLLKIELWSLAQYDQILYLDADTLPLSKDLLFLFEELEDQTANQIAAVPDVGWPDMFNSGVMMLVPDSKIYTQLHRWAIAKSSVDGADQGLLNQFFNVRYMNPRDSRARLGVSNKSRTKLYSREWIVMPFVNNVTLPNQGYESTPALRYFHDMINLVHFIGSQKPWKVSESALVTSRSHSEYVHEWWSLYHEFQTYYGLNEIMRSLTLDESIDEIASNAALPLAEQQKSQCESIMKAREYSISQSRSPKALPYLEPTSTEKKFQSSVNKHEGSSYSVGRNNHTLSSAKNNEEMKHSIPSTLASAPKIQPQPASEPKIKNPPTSSSMPLKPRSEFKFSWEDSPTRVERVFPS